VGLAQEGEENMDVGTLIADLRSEADKISRAIAALTGLGSTRPGRKRGVNVSRKGPAKKKRGGISAAGRKRLSMLMKKRWAERRKKGAKKL